MKKLLWVIVLIVILATIPYVLRRNTARQVEVGKQVEACRKTFEKNLIEGLNKDLVVTVCGADIAEFGYDFYVSDEMRLMVDVDFMKNIMGCAVLKDGNGGFLVMKGDTRIALTEGEDTAVVNDVNTLRLGSKGTKPVDDKVYVPIDAIASYLFYKVEYRLSLNAVNLELLPDEKKLPERYDMREFGRVTPVRDQGRYGTCWAFASLGALESTLLPAETAIFSTDHMTMCNSYSLDLNRGGERTMSIAYLAAWQGPVYEADDPYGDGLSDPNLAAVKHLEEALVIGERDMEALKSAIFRYGGVETSLFLSLEYADSESEYYQPEYASYYYDGEDIPNHDVVVIGWDDHYPKENFSHMPLRDGAWICKNSWGTAFGEDGYFYVSYEDKNICEKSVVYTKVAEPNNYDKIYQTDLLGWVGLMGYNHDEAYFANVYTAGEKEDLSAVSFYATGPDTRFEVYLVRDFKDQDSLNNREFLVAGSMQYAGYYTVDLPDKIELADGERFAVVVRVVTPDAVHPIAIEYSADDRTEKFDISDGEGYISLYGEVWHSAEETENCNVCLKAFTDYRGRKATQTDAEKSEE